MSSETYGLLNLKNINQTECLEKLLLKDGVLQSVPFEKIKDIPTDELRYFGHKNAVYQIITDELICFLNHVIDGKSAIEIGSGNGGLGKSLGIICTDSYQQERFEVQLIYALSGQPTIKYGAHVVRCDANAAVIQREPDVVIGAWITGQVDIHGNDLNAYGPQEQVILDMVDTYIMIGNLAVHNTKAIRKHLHYVVQAPWLVSRSKSPDKNAIFIWSKRDLSGIFESVDLPFKWERSKIDV